MAFSWIECIKKAETRVAVNNIFVNKTPSFGIICKRLTFTFICEKPKTFSTNKIQFSKSIDFLKIFLFFHFLNQIKCL
jgi:hypothetical protein